MNKEISVKNYFVYVVRYWLVIAICAVVGLGTGLLYAILSRTVEKTSFQGYITVGGVSTFFGDVGEVTEGQAAIYDKVKSNLFSAMTAYPLRVELYREVQNEWETLTKNTENPQSAQKAFFESFGLWTDGISMYVSFTQEYTTYKVDKLRSEKDAFSEKIVNRYLELALVNAQAVENYQTSPILDKLTSVQASEQLPSTEELGMGILKGCAVGLAGGAVGGLVILLAVWLIDRRITSYGDIAAMTGQRLFDVQKGKLSDKACPLIDCEMGGKNALLVTGTEETTQRLSELYASYTMHAGYKTLLLDFSRGKDSDTFGDYLGGKALGDCITDENGVAVLHGKNSWTAVLRESEKMDALKKEYGRLVICAPYYGDGSLGVLTSVTDKAVFAVDQGKMRRKDVLYMTQEMQRDEKYLGAAIENAGKSFVGGNTYVLVPAEE